MVVLFFAQQVFIRWLHRRDCTHLLVWSFGLALYAIGNFTEALYGLFGWRDGWGEVNFRLWYICGAVLAAAWLGQGTVFLLRRRIAWPVLGILIAGSIFAVVVIATAPIDPDVLRQNPSELTGRNVLPDDTRRTTVFFNVYGVAMLVGGAVWSAAHFWRQQTNPNRLIGNVLIALGAMSPAIGGVLNRFGFPGLYVGELVGAILVFSGFIAITREADLNLRTRRADANR